MIYTNTYKRKMSILVLILGICIFWGSLVQAWGASQSDKSVLYDKPYRGRGRLVHKISMQREPGTHTLFDFEGSEALKYWKTTDGASADLVQSPWADSQQAIRLKFVKDTVSMWPKVVISAPHISWPATSYQSTILSFRLKNMKPWQSQFRVLLGSSKRNFMWSVTELDIPAMAEREVKLDIGHGLSGSPGDFDELHLWVGGPRPYESELIVDDIVLTAGLVDEFARIRKQLDEANGITKRESNRVIRTQVQDALSRNQAKLNSLNNQIRQVKEYELAGSCIQDLQKLEQEITANGVLLTRLRAKNQLQTTKSKALFALGTESSMNKVHYRMLPFKRDFTRRLGQAVRLEAARGEFEHAQLVIVPASNDLKNVRWKAADLVGPGGHTIPIQVRPVGYFKTAPPPYEVDFVGWWPDPLMDYMDSVDVPGDAVQPIWLTVKVPGDAPAGNYLGSIQVTAEGAGTQETKVRLKVWDFTVPVTRHMRTAVHTDSELFRTPPEQGKYWDQAMKDKNFQFILDHRFNVDWIYDTACILDEPVETIRECKRRGQDYITIANVDTYSKDPDAWIAKVEKRYAKAKEAGVEDLVWFYGFDEVGLDRLPEMGEVITKVKQRFPWGRMIATIVDPKFGADNQLGKLIDAWVPTAQKYDEYIKAVADARQRGKEAWWYVCVGPYPPYPGLLTEQPGIDPRILMGVMYNKYGAQGFLYWSLSRITTEGTPAENNGNEILSDGPLCTWDPATLWGDHNGEGCFYFRGPKGPVSSIRFENMTDGIEDYEYYCILEDLLRKADARKAMFSPTDLKKIEAARNKAVVPDKIVRSVTDYTHSPEELLRTRKAVVGAIESLLSLGLKQD